MIILGAGLSGALCAVMNSNAKIYEGSENPESLRRHKALLRFRSDKISKIVGVPFRSVTVHKSIYFKGEHRAPNPALYNLYSKKVTNTYRNRSILNLDTETRFIAPDNFHDILLEICGPRITWNYKVSSIKIDSMFSSDGQYVERRKDPILSTLPMPVLSKIVEIPINTTFNSSSIKVRRYKIKNSEIFQTIYYPDPCSSKYRASITSDMLIIESLINQGDEDCINDVEVMFSFGIDPEDCTLVDESNQLGKIVPIDERTRKSFILNATLKSNVYSLGRFAVWRQILQDDVYDDILQIKELINRTHYDLHLKYFGQK